LTRPMSAEGSAMPTGDRGQFSSGAPLIKLDAERHIPTVRESASARKLNGSTKIWPLSFLSRDARARCRRVETALKKWSADLAEVEPRVRNLGGFPDLTP
jgi:hypothetical protein